MMFLCTCSYTCSYLGLVSVKSVLFFSNLFLILKMTLDIVCDTVLCPSCSSWQEVDRADGGEAEGVCDEAAGCTGSDRQGQEAEGSQGHPIPGSGCVNPLNYKQGVCEMWENITYNPLYFFLLSLLFPGVFDECDTEVDVLHWSRHNVFLLYDMGIFTALLELLSMEIE